MRKISILQSGFAILFSLATAIALVPAVAAASVTTQTWTIRQSPTTLTTTIGSWQSMTWSPSLGLFVAVANDATGNTVLTSPDAVTWTRRTPASNATWDSIAWSPSLGIFSAVAFNGAKMWSTDGINWTLGTGGPTDLWMSVAWSPSQAKFVAVSNSGTVMYSTDGKAWSATGVTGVGLDLWDSVTWSPDLGKFVAISNTSGTGNEVMTSPDGLAWTMQTSASSSNWISITSATSSTAVAAAVSAGGGGCTLSNTGVVLALAASPAAVQYSCDGVTWTNSTLPSSVSAYTFKQVAFGSTAGTSGLFMAVATSGFNMASPDGITWTDNSAAEPYTVSMKSVVWNPTGTDPVTGLTGFFAIISTSGAAAVVTTHDAATNWGLSQTTGYAWQSIAWSPSLSRLVAITNAGAYNRVMYSSDGGVTWSSANVPVSLNGSLPVPGAWRSITWSSDLSMFVAVGQTGTGTRTMHSSDGINWTLGTSAGDFTWVSVVYASSTTLASGIGCSAGTKGIFVASAITNGTTTRVMKSCDGISWSLSTTPNQNFNSITWAPTAGTGGQFVAVGTTAGTGNEIAYSSDAITWTTATAASSSSWNSVAWSPELSRFVAVSTTSGTSNIMVSPVGTAAGTWTSATSPVSASLNAVAWSPALGIFTAIGGSGTVIISDTATGTWTQKTAAAAYNWQSLVWAPELGTFVAVSTTGTTGDQIMTSQSAVAPTISSIGSTPDYTAATVTWMTDEQSSSKVLYSTDTSYGSSTTLDSTQVTSHSVALSGLLCSQLYHYEVQSTYLGLTTTSGDNTFTTTACDTPTVTVQAATSYTDTSATLNGTITATRGTSARSRGFNYGLTAPAYGSTTSESGLFDAGAYSLTVTGLACGTTYHYQATALNLTGSGTSTDTTFTTLACSAPTVTAGAASAIATTSATLNGTITGGSTATTRGFNYGLTSSYGTTTTESGSFAAGAFTAAISGLTCGTTYHFQSYATNAAGTGTSSPDATFDTSACAVVVTSSSSSNTTHVFYSVTPNGSAGAAPDFTLNGGAKTTSSRSVSVHFDVDARTVAGYAISLDPSLPGGIVPYASSTVRFMLPAAAGRYAVYVKFFSPTGNASDLLMHAIEYQPAAGSTAAFSRTLSVGMHGQDVLLLQQFLNTRGFLVAKSGPGSPGNETAFYGHGTARAVALFQEANAKDVLAPYGYAKGTGIFGPASRRLANTLLGS